MHEFGDDKKQDMLSSVIPIKIEENPSRTGNMSVKK